MRNRTKWYLRIGAAGLVVLGSYLAYTPAKKYLANHPGINEAADVRDWDYLSDWNPHNLPPVPKEGTQEYRNWVSLSEKARKRYMQETFENLPEERKKEMKNKSSVANASVEVATEALNDIMGN